MKLPHLCFTDGGVKVYKHLNPPFKWAELETMKKFHQKHLALDIYELRLECILEQIIANAAADHALFRKAFNPGLVTPQGCKK